MQMNDLGSLLDIRNYSAEWTDERVLKVTKGVEERTDKSVLWFGFNEKMGSNRIGKRVL